MINIEKIKQDYENLSSKNYTRLLPLQKIITLETAKEEIIDRFLSKIEKIDNNFEIVSTENFKLDDVISQAKKKFGPLNFFDKSIDNGKINIDIAFNFSLISIYYLNEKLKYRVTIFWDV
ncbi:MAG: hypothetical protein A2086_12300 [Spirochaetes bacterium GWD1_27_9]|nr:MAG: hypothetical protein A2Z98_01025 [Spirochaetes bacterium GWB1_27_13]OHD25870.1 MAG: hypothetical protein A2Y34_15325 [Spirochaetes bacterium GWC1_27_15]OHD34414.1 MAG: hypothetical protein A2086_12300 [Spirochaetes bacterium GWD1_27_9]